VSLRLAEEATSFGTQFLSFVIVHSSDFGQIDIHGIRISLSSSSERLSPARGIKSIIPLRSLSSHYRS
jgi:hypothetical protein